ncbi:TPA: DUF6557 family protein [Enterococcus faecium]|uniref:DUF6557 family protein n=1 Tax=Enterococcus TaxID=1350 RepID=UPI00115F6613|nr:MULTISPECIES: DUF6557 family protein [Enterococcus]MBE6167872.1 hypothetical protein [Enterococcus faecium]MDT2675218.1 hypothetical protein [Enterococcus dongliensis]HCD9037878.1 hypothetical protein [Enterococcus faecium]
MESIGTKLYKSLVGELNNQIIKYLKEQYMEDFSTEEIAERVDTFKKVIESANKSEVSLEDCKLIVAEEIDDFEASNVYWHVSLLYKSNDTYAIDFIPLNELLNYPVEGYEENVALIGDVIWELTFDGWTVEEQQKRISEMNKRVEE